MHLKTMMLKARMYGRKLDKTRRKLEPVEFGWFPYPVMDNVGAISGLLTNGNRNLFKSLKGGTVADLGGADGELAFFLESQGMKVDFVDTEHANYNQLKGVRALADALKSKVGIHDIDLDAGFSLPRERYDLILLLGTLYHLKNPYLVLETLSGMTQYLLLSTRIASFSRDQGIDYRSEPMAYLLDPDECNNDATNFWIFSKAGLHRLVSRCGWSVLDYCSYGARDDSIPQGVERDERAWMLLESTALTE